MKKMMRIALFLVLVISLSAAAEQAVVNRPGLSLKETFDLYVRSVQNSSLEGLFSTVTQKDFFRFFTASGDCIRTREEYYRFHEEWFRETDWEMPVEVLDIFEGKDWGFTTAVFHYKEGLPGGGKRVLDSYFTLIFQKEEGMWKVITDICTPIKRLTLGSDPSLVFTPEQDYLYKIIHTRRTVRNFRPDPVPDEHLLKILEAARMAPTAGNQQPWKFLVVRDRTKLNALKKEALSWYLEKAALEGISREKANELEDKLKDILPRVLSAPVYIAVLVDSEAEHPGYVLYDGSLAAGTLMIAARSLGYGTGFFTTFFPENKMRIFFHIPEKYRLICFTPIGIPEEWPDAPPKKKLEEFVVYESFK
ncbi:MAG: nitroreductase family protein [Candidatus Aminicenantes bacterium]|nr:nitroreductase family protein [Candidatus Aminicenantes bacterium]